MPDRDTGSRQMMRALLLAGHLMPDENLTSLVAGHAAVAGLHDVAIWLCDVQQSVLRRLPGPDPGPDPAPGGSGTELPVDGTLAGRAFQYGRILSAPGSDGKGFRWWVPLLDGSERLGVLAVRTEADDAHTVEDMECLAALVAVVLVSRGDHSDFLARLVRTRRMTAAAEMQWQLMPPRAYADDHVVIGAVMEPAYEVAGDAYDYATDRGKVRLAIFDAMGHDTAAGLTANLAVASCRNQRRQGVGLPDIGPGIERVLLEQFHRDAYVTAVLADLDARTGMLRWISHGHHPPVVIRGGRWITYLHCSPGHPLGTDLGLSAAVCHEQLEPGDRVVLYTDGITEARNPGGQEFGLHGFLDFLMRHHADALPVPETMRRLIRSILGHHHGTLRDDATVLLLEWHGPTPYPPGQAAALLGIPKETRPPRLAAGGPGRAGQRA
ncbi:PP2C family protein-serine/threonine phosphatase [Streptomyces sp. FIT100]|uniref:PP2C family protein-serine/threonine phosphatase n=1 Tax=Streptomyces sp. FIT100 TaxID=2837956 RepID=UPI0021CA0C6B|nr:PP2C family protein-serine/threonine phosphatase [Streptomyces sp. FIT100]